MLIHWLLVIALYIGVLGPMYGFMFWYQMRPSPEEKLIRARIAARLVEFDRLFEDEDN